MSANSTYTATIRPGTNHPWELRIEDNNNPGVPIGDIYGFDSEGPAITEIEREAPAFRRGEEVNYLNELDVATDRTITIRKQEDGTWTAQLAPKPTEPARIGVDGTIAVPSGVLYKQQSNGQWIYTMEGHAFETHGREVESADEIELLDTIQQLTNTTVNPRTVFPSTPGELDAIISNARSDQTAALIAGLRNMNLGPCDDAADLIVQLVGTLDQLDMFRRAAHYCVDTMIHCGVVETEDEPVIDAVYDERCLNPTPEWVFQHQEPR